jgi:hypothetical protein
MPHTTVKQDGQCRHKVTSRRFRATIVAVKNEVSVIHRECVFVALGIQHAISMRYSVVCGLPRCTIFFPPFLTNGTKVTEAKMCVLVYSATFILKISHSKKI